MKILDYDGDENKPSQFLSKSSYGIVRYMLMLYFIFKLIGDADTFGNFTIAHDVLLLFCGLVVFVLIITASLYQLKQGKYELGTTIIYKKRFPRYVSILVFVFTILIYFGERIELKYIVINNNYLQFLFLIAETILVLLALLVISYRDIVLIPKEIKTSNQNEV